MAGKHDDRDVSRVRVALQCLNELPSVSAREGQFRDEDVRMLFTRVMRGLRIVSRCDCLEAKRSKGLDVHFTGIVVAVNDEYHRPERDGTRVSAMHGETFRTSHLPQITGRQLRSSVRI